ncbi:type II toxin-antitoxin system RelB/DinJ family antitoxin [Candidatus Gottesmanbacteria bacterium]|nr:type II toxin-antitoxin system RelB/DinJ family antitoxin [Candidatus Gottesmanbacteria bacterium]
MKTVINVKADLEVKKNAQKLAKELGLTLSAIINAYLKQFIRSRELYFTSQIQMSPGLERLLGPIETDIKKDRNISAEISSAKELKKYFSRI